MSEHTPGPWHIAQMYVEHGLTMNDGAISVAAGGENGRIAVVDYRGEDPPRKRYNAKSPERDANARLIAAAPDMLAALKDIKALADWAGDLNVKRMSIERVASAAIAKAEGKEP